MSAVRLKISIGAKLIGLIALLLVVSVITLTSLATHLFIEDNTALIQQINADTAANLSGQVTQHFVRWTELLRWSALAMMKDQAKAEKNLEDTALNAKSDLLAAFLISHQGEKNQVTGKALSRALMTSGLGDAIESLLNDSTSTSLTVLRKGEVLIDVWLDAEKNPYAMIGIPVVQKRDEFSHSIIGIFKQDKLRDTFSENALVTSYLVDRKGKLLAHPNATFIAESRSVAHLEPVKQLLRGQFHNGQLRYMDPSSKEGRLGAFRSVGFGGTGIVAEVPEEKAFEAARTVAYRVALFAMIVLCVAFLVGYLYSDTITFPIKQLVGASERISEGDFKIELKPHTRDEMATLFESFNGMAKGLEERDRIKATFQKFHNKEIASKLLSGEVKLGGEKREAVIFFSDIRGFTTMGEAMPPEAVVEMLNEYLTRMVKIIHEHGGVVDKYIGDAIMAIWGVPIQKDDDADRALEACLKMRSALADLNSLRQSRGQNTLAIGMGLNFGPVIAGNIGSDERMEYTVIGDSVNLASRIESLTKELKTDLLLSRSVLDRTHLKLPFEPCGEMKVKGKNEPVELYKIVATATTSAAAAPARSPAEQNASITEVPASTPESEQLAPEPSLSIEPPIEGSEEASLEEAPTLSQEQIQAATDDEDSVVLDDDDEPQSEAA